MLLNFPRAQALSFKHTGAPVKILGLSNGMFIAPGTCTLCMGCFSLQNCSHSFSFRAAFLWYWICCWITQSETSGLPRLAGLQSCRSLCGVIQLSCRTWNVLLRGILLYCLSKLSLTSVILQYAFSLFLYLFGLHATQNQYQEFLLKKTYEMLGFSVFWINSKTCKCCFEQFLCLNGCAPRSIFNSVVSV